MSHRSQPLGVNPLEGKARCWCLVPTVQDTRANWQLRRRGSAHSTTTVPWSIFIPHANARSLPLVGVNSITTALFSGNARVILNDGKTTSVPHVLSVVRRNVRRAGTPA